MGLPNEYPECSTYEFSMPKRFCPMTSGSDIPVCKFSMRTLS